MCFVGYPFDTKGYKVLDLVTKKIHISRDVIFHENIFLFAISSENSSFPSVLHLLSSNPPKHHSTSRDQDSYGLHDKDVPISVNDELAVDTNFTHPITSPLTSPNSTCFNNFQP